MSMLSYHRHGILILALVLLEGCSSGAHDELEAYISSVKARPESTIEALPEVKPYQSFVYGAGNLKDPFAPAQSPTDAHQGHDSTSKPDPDRPREPLEQFSLDALKMLGTLSRDGQLYAILQDKEGLVYRVVIGNYIGQNDGRIESISDHEIKVKEMVSDGSGGWKERMSSIALVPPT